MIRCGKVTLVTWAGGGNTPPMLEIARRLVSRGHEVTVCGPDSLREPVVTLGALFVVPERVSFPDVAAVQFESDPSAFQEMLFGPVSARSLAAVLDVTSAEVVVVDCMHFAALTAATALGVPTVPFVHMRYGFFTESPQREFIDAWIGPLVAESRRTLGLGELGSNRSIARQLWEDAPVAVSMLPPILESELSEPVTNLVHGGPLFSRAPTTGAPPDSRPRILVSFSTTMMDQGDVLTRVIAALGSLEVDGLVTLGGVAFEPPALPDNVKVVPWLDPFEVLPATALVVTHAGMGTVLATLAHGVPMVSIPMGRDQDGNAGRVAEIGAGIALPLDTSADGIAAATTDVLGQARFAHSARGVAQEIQSLDGGSAAIIAIESQLR